MADKKLSIPEVLSLSEEEYENLFQLVMTMDDTTMQELEDAIIKFHENLKIFNQARKTFLSMELKSSIERPHHQRMSLLIDGVTLNPSGEVSVIANQMCDAITGASSLTLRQQRSNGVDNAVVARTYETSAGVVVVAFLGTKGASSLYEDLDGSMVHMDIAGTRFRSTRGFRNVLSGYAAGSGDGTEGSPTTYSAADIAYAFGIETGERVVWTGHSLGAVMASYCSLAFGSEPLLFACPNWLDGQLLQKAHHTVMMSGTQTLYYDDLITVVRSRLNKLGEASMTRMLTSIQSPRTLHSLSMYREMLANKVFRLGGGSLAP
jgi:hypothetical protein